MSFLRTVQVWHLTRNCLYPPSSNITVNARWGWPRYEKPAALLLKEVDFDLGQRAEYPHPAGNRKSCHFCSLKWPHHLRQATNLRTTEKSNREVLGRREPYRDRINSHVLRRCPGWTWGSTRVQGRSRRLKPPQVPGSREGGSKHKGQGRPRTASSSASLAAWKQGCTPAQGGQRRPKRKQRRQTWRLLVFSPKQSRPTSSWWKLYRLDFQTNSS